jgi:hypothetical protein
MLRGHKTKPSSYTQWNYNDANFIQRHKKYKGKKNIYDAFRRYNTLQSTLVEITWIHEWVLGGQHMFIAQKQQKLALHTVL